MTTDRAANAGFTLLEILVAFTIATTALGLMFRIHASSTSTVLLSEEYQGATALAQALIAEHSVTQRRIDFTTNGSAGRYRWTARGDPYATAALADAERPPPYLLRTIAVEVSWAARERERRVTLRTIKPFFEPGP